MAIKVGTYYITPFGGGQLREVTALDGNLVTYNIWSSLSRGWGENLVADLVPHHSLFEFPISKDKAECLISLWTNQ